MENPNLVNVTSESSYVIIFLINSEYDSVYSIII